MRGLSVFTLLFPALLGLVTARPYAATPHRRSIDTCANIGLDISLLIVHVQLKICLCLSGIDALLATNLDLKLAATILGAANVKARLVDAVNRGSGKHECTYPDHAIADCTSGDVCHYHCPPDRVKSNGQCVCPPGKKDCNGKCITGVCSSQTPSCPGGKCGRGEMTYRKRSMFCASGMEVCSVPGSLGSWECVRTNEDLESCGGCTFPFFPEQKPGVDCSALPGVHSVGCDNGACRVSKCKAKWRVTKDKRACEAAF